MYKNNIANQNKLCPEMGHLAHKQTLPLFQNSITLITIVNNLFFLYKWSEPSRDYNIAIIVPLCNSATFKVDLAVTDCLVSFLTHYYMQLQILTDLILIAQSFAENPQQKYKKYNSHMIQCS